MSQNDFKEQDAFIERLVRYQDGGLSERELEEMEAELRTSPDRRRLWAEVQLRSALMHDHFRIHPLQALQRNDSVQKKGRPLVRRSWMAAAAGLVLGCLSTSMVWAVNSKSWTDGHRRIHLPLANPGFEHQESLPQFHLVPLYGQWSGRDTGILSSEEGFPKPKGGRGVIRLGPAPEGKGYFASLMTDISTGRAMSSKSLQVEVSAYFHASRPGQGEHYLLRAATSSGRPPELAASWENSWKEMDPLILTSTAKSIYPTPLEEGWQKITVRLDVPPHAQTLLISLGANTPGPVSGRTDHYMDDVQASWIVPQESVHVPASNP
jgi:hypothetical protein